MTLTGVAPVPFAYETNVLTIYTITSFIMSFRAEIGKQD